MCLKSRKSSRATRRGLKPRAVSGGEGFEEAAASQSRIAAWADNIFIDRSGAGQCWRL